MPRTEEKKLRERGYTIFLDTPPDLETWQRMAIRSVRPKRPDEWLAIKVSWVNNYQKGPEDAPYVPSIRVPG